MQWEAKPPSSSTKSVNNAPAAVRWPQTAASRVQHSPGQATGQQVSYETFNPAGMAPENENKILRLTYTIPHDQSETPAL